ncbi:MAG: PDZ domain-containing protein [Gammaproteobacteria bacterium]|nr:PDZ domain-containing protein [Gammaproteobacteria bacterium]
MGVLIRSAEGAVVDGFADDSPAARAGMRPGDAIVEIDGRVIGRFEDVRLALWDKRPGDSVRLVVRRGGDERVELSFELY